MDVEREIDRHDVRIRALEDLAIKFQFEELRADLKEIKAEQRRQREQKERDDRAAVSEKKADRRWQIATAFTTATFVLGAGALILQAFGGA